jgi:replication initiation and membrane attachment protein DnaB
MNEKEEKSIEEIKKEIVIERLRQAPPTVKISFGTENGKFMSRDEMIEQVERNTELGKRIVNIQLEYLRAFKKGTLVGG